VVLLAVTSAGCGQGTSTGDVTTADAASAPPGGAIDDPTDDRFRFTTATEVVAGGQRRALATPVTGMVDRHRAEVRVDVSSRLAPQELPRVEPGDLAVEARIDADGLYLRAPFMVAAADRLAVLRAAGPLSGSPPPGGDGWVAVEPRALGDVPWHETAGRLAGIQSLEPHVFVELADTAVPGPAPLGDGTIDGVAVTGVRADVDHLRALRALGFPVAELAGLTEALRGRTVALEVWTDADDLVRRVVLGTGWAPLDAAAAEQGTVPPDVALLAAGSTTRIDITGYGDRAIRVAAPGRTVDISDAYQADRPGGGVDVLTDTWLSDLKGDLAAIRYESDRLTALQQLQAQLDAGVDGYQLIDGVDGTGDAGGLGEPLDPGAVPAYDPGATEALLAEGEQLRAEAEALNAETDRALQESDAVLEESEQVLADQEPPPP
jgi:hypothetical protein